MAINADTLLDRLYLKAQIARWRLLAIAFGVLALIIFFDKNSLHSPIEGDFIARLTFDQIVLDDQRIYELIDDVASNPRAKAVVVWLDTPGGSAVAGEEIYLRLRELSKEKPVIAVMRSVAASAGYMIALGADHIIAREGTITGSIGVLMESFEVTELAEKIGVKPVIIKTAPLKASPNPLEKTTPEAERVIQEVIDDFYGRFVEMVAERRKLPKERALSLADGRVYSGKRALEYKLIDAIGGEQEAMVWLTEQKKIKPDLDIKDIKIEEELGFFDQLAESTSKIFFNSKSIGLDGMAAIWHPDMH
ncbi:MAG: signal peptide peptidase SppA [Alphaproteobacteria bacterium]